jgi:hypothetical protein
MTTEPDQKFAIRANDDQKPGGVLLGNYDKMSSAETLPGMN